MLSKNELIAIYLAVSVGVSIGLLTGFLVARVGIPSFVVTVALFLAWQGVVLLLIGQGGAISLAPYDTVTGFMNKNLSPARRLALHHGPDRASTSATRRGVPRTGASRA